MTDRTIYVALTVEEAEALRRELAWTGAMEGCVDTPPVPSLLHVYKILGAALDAPNAQAELAACIAWVNDASHPDSDGGME